ncbi:ABC-F family ATP-binding cassette domain-containing protein [Dactylosporangium aurantiacum]|uniref:ABC-F family ATP-binding cassette domain-containing protein n=1 Tax=Dactylosporangium aurantiacum TaxID=35754 RepID=A0A9Q9IKI3_9ACTN|nr:ABC-F family ATP-binding cassette domain-containing protein [Dactylosporangium aurantiacum]MDG6108574.1 ABC-F family ATP-binding cassette domain-containing protein [Dactylosporangium aurantiacum]UWZ57241.1 ABC-F family ATP-binding cassette domain-containing protein [Dactylosporangium aurantiacum]
MSFSPLLAHDLVRTFGTRRVLDGVSLTAAPGHRIGLIGENGAGKSTLLRLLAGVDEPETGTVERPADLGYLHQEMPFDAGATVADVIDDALREAREDVAALESPDALSLAEYGERLERAQLHDAWDADRRAGLVLDGLGLGGVAHERTLGTLSGGQRGRLALAALLIRRPSALLLDEPTNHLDDDAAAFLEAQLRDLPGAVVLASHDRAFLDAVCTDLVDLDPAVDGPTRYGGNYTDYQAAKRAERERWQRRFEEEQEELHDLRRAVAVTAHQVAPGRERRDSEKMGYGHTAGRVQQQISRRVRNATRRLDDLTRTQVRKPPAPLRFNAAALAAAPSAVDGLLVSLRDVSVPGRLTLPLLDLAATDRLLVTGANGAGKSTLLAVLAGRLAATGTVQRRRGLTVGLLAQDTVFDRPDLTVAATYEQTLGPDRAEAVPLRSLGLLAPRDLARPVGELSVGQRRRLGLALLVANPPELLLLDEPTNHLSPRLADELEEALGTGPGATVVASHDRWLRARWAGRSLRL